MINLATYNLQHLYYFHVVATEESIKAASTQLRLTQSAISIRITSLEQDLETKLFTREFRQLRLTSAGQRLFEYTNQIFSLAEKAILSLGHQENPKKILRAGFVPSVSNALVHDILRPLWRKDLILHIQQGSFVDLHHYLYQGKLDLMIVDTEPKIKHGWKVKEVAQRRLIFAGASKFKGLRGSFPKSLSAVPFISFSDNNALCFQVDRFLALHRISPNIIGRIDDFSLLLSFLTDGIAVGVVSDRAAQPFLKSDLLFNLGEINNVISRLWVVERENNI